MAYFNKFYNLPKEDVISWNFLFLIIIRILKFIQIYSSVGYLFILLLSTF